MSSRSSIYLKLIFFFSALILCKCLKLSSIEKCYQKGIKAYNKERWSECIAQFEESLHLYKLCKAVIINCRLKCNSENFKTDILEPIEDLKIYEQFFNKRNCLTNCKENNFEDAQLHSTLDDSILFNMQSRKPYDYLHMCYFHMNILPKAASAAYTYLVANPSDDSMQKNLQYYVEQPEVDIEEVVDLQSDDYVVLYNLGISAYNQKNWADTVANMEEAISDYLSSENNCRLECERQPEQEWSPEFIITVSNNIASLLHCRQQCQDAVKVLKYNSGKEFLAEILNYIQISYYHLDRFQDAAKAVESYLVLIPNDVDMLENKRIYSFLTDETAFVKRSDIDYYFRRDTQEKNLLNFFHQGSDNGASFNTI